ncbi:hypothetical protein [Saccharomonospora iraqiensis]|uniref:hypothetical protein n=1 Tax=Saccharomonospora iraqiensis TaxID=52698 RepID=UPI00022DF896|nr:hypothetical protein [Saccharomonospora iraqiensis]
MAGADTWFLLVQYRHQGKTDVTEFRDITHAANAYSEAEQRYKDRLKGADPEMDVLLVGAESLAVVKERYPSYFLRAKTRSDKLLSLIGALPSVPAY